MARNFSWRHQNRIKADITNRFVRVRCEPNLCGGCNPPTLPLANRFRSLIEVGPRFHLGEDQELAPACDDIDFTERAPPASRQNANPFAIRKAAARLSAEMPTRNAACRSGRGAGFGGRDG